MRVIFIIHVAHKHLIFLGIIYINSFLYIKWGECIYNLYYNFIHLSFIFPDCTVDRPFLSLIVTSAGYTRLFCDIHS